jgi:DNA repair protein RadD
MSELRPYQKEAVDTIFQYLRECSGNPCIEIPTAGGKTHVIAEICRLVIAHSDIPPPSEDKQ